LTRMEAKLGVALGTPMHARARGAPTARRNCTSRKTVAAVPDLGLVAVTVNLTRVGR